MKKLLIFIGIISFFYGLFHFCANLFHQSHTNGACSNCWWGIDILQGRREPLLEIIRFIITYGYGILWWRLGYFLIDKGNGPKKLVLSLNVIMIIILSLTLFLISQS